MLAQVEATGWIGLRERSHRALALRGAQLRIGCNPMGIGIQLAAQSAGIVSLRGEPMDQRSNEGTQPAGEKNVARQRPCFELVGPPRGGKEARKLDEATLTYEVGRPERCHAQPLVAAVAGKNASNRPASRDF